MVFRDQTAVMSRKGDDSDVKARRGTVEAWRHCRMYSRARGNHVGGSVEIHETGCRHGDMLQPGPLTDIGPILADRLADYNHEPRRMT